MSKVGSAMRHARVAAQVVVVVRFAIEDASSCASFPIGGSQALKLTPTMISDVETELQVET